MWPIAPTERVGSWGLKYCITTESKCHGEKVPGLCFTKFHAARHGHRPMSCAKGNNFLCFWGSFLWVFLALYLC